MRSSLWGDGLEKEEQCMDEDFRSKRDWWNQVTRCRLEGGIRDTAEKDHR